MLVDRRTLREHWPWILASLFVCVGAIAAYAIEVGRAGRWITGGSALGFALGVVGGAIIVFEMLIWPRKKWRTLRAGRVKIWMRAHIWLGLLCLPLLILHGGFYFDNPLANVLTVLLVVVVLSGLYGLILQNILPKKMLEDLPAETIHSQIGRVAWYSLRDADRLVREVCGARPGESIDDSIEPDEETRKFVVVGAVRTAGLIQGKTAQTRKVPDPIVGAEPLREFFETRLRPFLAEIAEPPEGAPALPPIADPNRSASFDAFRSPNKSRSMFQDLKTKLPVAAHEVVDALERLCDQRRQFDRQRLLQGMLHNWLLVHLPLSIALLVLMFAHVYLAVKYW